MYLDDLSVTVLQSGSTGFAEKEGQQIRLWPNPGSEGFELSGLSTSSVRMIRVVDMEGRVVLEEQRASAVHRHTPCLLALEPGVYLVEVNTPEGWVRCKWVKH
jgi:hypothetical protein